MPESHIDTVELARELIRCPSVTPEDAGALTALERALSQFGFRCHRLRFEEDGTPPVDNLYARLGDSGPNFCFAGHTDVVPVGDRDAWSVDPFAADIRDGRLYGRGASDMKGAVAAFVTAAARVTDNGRNLPNGSISLLITGDEEGPAINGTVKVLDWLKQRDETIDVCLVGEPTNPHEVGEMIKIGRRGSLTGTLTVRGQQGHVAYPHLADNPIPHMVRYLEALTALELDQGNGHFQASNLEVTTVDVGNPATNVIPAQARAVFNIRFNTEWSGTTLSERLRQTLDGVGNQYDLDITVGSEPFLTPPGPFSDLLAGAVERVTGRKPDLSTTGGTSDARFIKDHCPVAEFGMIGQTMHKVDEHVSVAELELLSRIYETILNGYFDR